MEDAKKFIIDNPDLLDALGVLEDTWQDIVNEAKDKYTKLMAHAVNKRANPTSDGKMVVDVRSDEDGDGQFIGVKLKNTGDDQPVSGEVASKYAALLESIVGTSYQNKYWNIGWYNPVPFERHQRFENLPRRQILALHNDDTLMTEFVGKIQKQVDKVIGEMVAFK